MTSIMDFKDKSSSIRMVYKENWKVVCFLCYM